MTSHRARILYAAALVGGCGGRTPAPIDDEPTALPTASALFVEDAMGCGQQAPLEQASELLTDEQLGDALYLVEVAFSDECTGLGGNHLIARAVDGSRFFWLGGHGCQFVPASVAGGSTWFGIVRVSHTAALFHLPTDVCLGFPGETGAISTDSKVGVMALYASREDAEKALLAVE